MSSPLERVLAIDWSGDKAAGHRKIWLCEVVAGRVIRLGNGRSREEVAEHLIKEAERDPHFVVGLDFAFSFPAGFLRKRGHRRIDTVWEETARHGEEWLRDCPNPPFWGRPGKRKPAFGDALYRRTDREIAAAATGRRPMSVFQIGGAGAVGTGSLRGMPLLATLRAAGFSIWPFHEAGSPTVVEIWPRVFTGPVHKSRAEERRRLVDRRYPGLQARHRAAAEASDDAFDALVSALEMDRRRAELETLQPSPNPEERLEGRIWAPADRDPRS